MKRLWVILFVFITLSFCAFLFPDIAYDLSNRTRAVLSVFSTILLISISSVLIFVSILLYIRYKRKKAQIKFLFQKLKLDKKTLTKFNKKSINKLYKSSIAKKSRDGNFTLEVGTTSVAVFDMLYTLSKVDPFVLFGINHLHHDQNFESMGDLTSFMNENIITSSKGSEAYVDMIHKYKGYTGEEAVFERIGIENITVPESAVNEGYDFIYNSTGQKYDIKVWSSTDHIKQELNNLPEDVKLWVNKEHAAEFSNHPRVHVDQNLSESHIFELTDNTFNSIDSMSDLINSSIPIATLTISSYKNYKLVKSGTKNKKDAMQDVLLDTAGVGIGSMIGTGVGSRLSQYLTPIIGPWSVAIIPISAALGSLIGIITGKGIVKWYKERHIRNAQKELKLSLIDYEKTFRNNLGSIIKKEKNKANSCKDKYNFLIKQNQNILLRYLWPNTFSTFCEISSKKISEEFQNYKNYYINLKNKMKKMKNKEERGLFLFSQGNQTVSMDQNLNDIWNVINNKISLLKIEIQKAKEK